MLTVGGPLNLCEHEAVSQATRDSGFIGIDARSKSSVSRADQTQLHSITS